jgi:peptide methionine sulfoxide reductase MsrA
MISKKEFALSYKTEIGKSIYKNSIFTKIIPFTNLYKAEDYYKDYHDKNKQTIIYFHN